MIIIKKDLKQLAYIANHACETLKKGGLVVVPSDTVYGLAVDATNPTAVNKLIEFKSRPAGKPISVFVSSLEDFSIYAKVSKKQKQLLKNILPGRCTVVLPSKHILDNQLESERGTLGLRLVDFEFITKLVYQFGNPITATSANISGASPHYSVDSLLNSLSQKKKDMIDLIVDFGQLTRNKPSTVIDLTEDEVMILRQGDHTFSKNTPGVAGWTPRGWGNQTFISHSEEETKKIAQKIIVKNLSNIEKKTLVIILQGELGSGKTQFVKGIGDYFGIRKIISPTFVICYEYEIPIHPKSVKLLYHVDLYNISEKNEFEYLGFEDMLKPGNIICIEWGEKSGEIMPLLKQKAEIVSVTIKYIDEKNREIIITGGHSGKPKVRPESI